MSGGKNKVDVDDNEENDSDAFLISRLCADLMEEPMDDDDACLDGVLVDIPVQARQLRGDKKSRKKKIAAKKTN